MPGSSEPTTQKLSIKQQQVTPKSIKFVDGPGYYSFYCNNIAFSVNQLDIALTLGEMIEFSPDGEVLVERRARVTMTGAQAKAISRILSHAVALYEAQPGTPPVMDLPMNLPADVKE